MGIRPCRRPKQTGCSSDPILATLCRHDSVFIVFDPRLPAAPESKERLSVICKCVSVLYHPVNNSHFVETVCVSASESYVSLHIPPNSQRFRLVLDYFDRFAFWRPR